MKECRECKTTHDIEKHHVIFRSQSKIMQRMDINIYDLCSWCHRGKYGPHKSKAKDLEYKREIQAQLKEILFKDYYSAEGLKKALKLNKTQFRYIEKNLMLYNEGYNSEEIIRYMLGGKMY